MAKNPRELTEALDVLTFLRSHSKKGSFPRSGCFFLPIGLERICVFVRGWDLVVRFECKFMGLFLNFLLQFRSNCVSITHKS